MKNIRKIDFEDNKDVENFINNTESGLYDGYNEDNIMVVYGVEKSVGMRVSTYQNNGWIRINEYLIDEDEGIVRTETYTK